MIEEILLASLQFQTDLDMSVVQMDFIEILRDKALFMMVQRKGNYARN